MNFSQTVGDDVKPCKGNILVVDDTPDNLRLLTTMLTERGYKVRSALNGQMALMGTQALPPDLILLDLNMPDMSGYEVCQALKSDPKTQDIPIIFISALDQIWDKVKAFRIGGVDYITKPFQLEEVLVRVESQITLRQLQQQLHLQNLQLQREVQDRKQVEMSLLKVNQHLQHLAQELQKLAVTDELTQLANRRRFDECLDGEWKRLARENLPLALILCDIDDFKLYNDAYGHLAGDTCLKQVARAIQSAVRRPADLVARYGGEEFGVILPNTDAKGATWVAEMILEAVRDLKIPHERSRVGDYVTLSIGVSNMVPNLGLSPSSLLLATDRLLYMAKHQGKNRIIHQPLEPLSL